MRPKQQLLKGSITSDTICSAKSSALLVPRRGIGMQAPLGCPPELVYHRRLSLFATPPYETLWAEPEIEIQAYQPLGVLELTSGGTIPTSQ
jgi:hypothetical protein